jgi:hypothetical protein
MLERSHLLVVRAVAKGIKPGPSPALRAVLEEGLVVQVGGQFRITAAGQEALAADEAVSFRPSPPMIVGAVAVILLAVVAIVI